LTKRLFCESGPIADQKFKKSGIFRDPWPGRPEFLNFKENAYKFNRESMAGGFGWRPAALAGAQRLDFYWFFDKTLWIH